MYYSHEVRKLLDEKVWETRKNIINCHVAAFSNSDASIYLSRLCE